MQQSIFNNVMSDHAENASSFFKAGLSATERFTAMNLHAMSAEVDALSETFSSLTDALFIKKCPQVLMGVVADSSREAIQRAISHTRSFYEAATAIGEEADSRIEQVIEKGDKVVENAVKEVLENIPAPLNAAAGQVVEVAKTTKQAVKAVAKTGKAATKKASEALEKNVVASTESILSAAKAKPKK